VTVHLIHQPLWSTLDRLGIAAKRAPIAALSDMIQHSRNDKTRKPVHGEKHSGALESGKSLVHCHRDLAILQK
jgi:hypothetical protein